MGCWTRKLPEAGLSYTPFEQQLLAAYWALVETEQLTLGHDVLLRPKIPIMPWLNTDPASHKIGHAQESSIKWKWYIKNRAKPGPTGVLNFHELVADSSIEPAGTSITLPNVVSSPVQYNDGYDSLTPKQQQHAWFTDGSAKYLGHTRHWKAVAYNPKTAMILETQGEGASSSQYGQVYAMYQALKHEKGKECHLFTDSWAVANGLTTWMPRWAQDNWTIHGKELWGSKLWQEIWDIVKLTIVSVFHVDGHSSSNSTDCKYNAEADQLAAIATATTDPGLAKWVHERSGHLGAHAMHRWAGDRGMSIPISDCKDVSNECPTCQLDKQRPLPKIITGELFRGKVPAQGWQIDYIGPLPWSRGCQYT